LDGCETISSDAVEIREFIELFRKEDLVCKNSKKVTDFSDGAAISLT